MKTHILKPLAPFACAVALCAGSTINTCAQDNWETVFPPDAIPSSGLAMLTSIATSPGGHVFSGGWEYDMATDVTSAILVRSLDRGATWQETARIPGYQFEKVSVGGEGTVYLLAASSSDTSSGQLWRSIAANAGANLEPVAEFRSFLGNQHYVTDLAADGQGNVFICGAINVPSGRTSVERWMVAKGVPNTTGGLDWSLVDQYTMDNKNNSSAQDIAIKPSTDLSAPAQIWVHGWPGHRASSTRAIRRSLDGGATWQTVHTYDNGGILGNGAVLAVTGTGEVYAHGEMRVWVNKKTAQDYYVTRRSLDGGVNWQIVDQSPKHVYGWAKAVAVRPDGAVFAARDEHSSVGEPWRWMVRASPRGDAGTWATSDAGFPGDAESIAIDGEGSVYVAGRGGEWNGSHYGLIRKLQAATAQ